MVAGLIGPTQASPNDVLGNFAQIVMEWQLIIRARFERDPELAIIDPGGTVHALSFPCCRTFDVWLHPRTKKWLVFRPNIGGTDELNLKS